MATTMEGATVKGDLASVFKGLSKGDLKVINHMFQILEKKWKAYEKALQSLKKETCQVCMTQGVSHDSVLVGEPKKIHEKLMWYYNMATVSQIFFRDDTVEQVLNQLFVPVTDATRHDICIIIPVRLDRVLNDESFEQNVYHVTLKYKPESSDLSLIGQKFTLVIDPTVQSDPSGNWRWLNIALERDDGIVVQPPKDKGWHITLDAPDRQAFKCSKFSANASFDTTQCVRVSEMRAFACELHKMSDGVDPSKVLFASDCDGTLTHFSSSDKSPMEIINYLNTGSVGKSTEFSRLLARQLTHVRVITSRGYNKKIKALFTNNLEKSLGSIGLHVLSVNCRDKVGSTPTSEQKDQLKANSIRNMFCGLASYAFFSEDTSSGVDTICNMIGCAILNVTTEEIHSCKIPTDMKCGQQFKFIGPACGGKSSLINKIVDNLRKKSYSVKVIRPDRRDNTTFQPSWSRFDFIFYDLCGTTKFFKDAVPIVLTSHDKIAYKAMCFINAIQRKWHPTLWLNPKECSDTFKGFLEKRGELAVSDFDCPEFHIHLDGNMVQIPPTMSLNELLNTYNWYDVCSFLKEHYHKVTIWRKGVRVQGTVIQDGDVIKIAYQEHSKVFSHQWGLDSRNAFFACVNGKFVSLRPTLDLSRDCWGSAIEMLKYCENSTSDSIQDILDMINNKLQGTLSSKQDGSYCNLQYVINHARYIANVPSSNEYASFTLVRQILEESGVLVSSNGALYATDSFINEIVLPAFGCKNVGEFCALCEEYKTRIPKIVKTKIGTDGQYFHWSASFELEVEGSRSELAITALTSRAILLGFFDHNGKWHSHYEFDKKLRTHMFLQPDWCPFPLNYDEFRKDHDSVICGKMCYLEFAKKYCFASSINGPRFYTEYSAEGGMLYTEHGSSFKLKTDAYYHAHKNYIRLLKIMSEDKSLFDQLMKYQGKGFHHIDMALKKAQVLNHVQLDLTSILTCIVDALTKGFQLDQAVFDSMTRKKVLLKGFLAAVGLDLKKYTKQKKTNKRSKTPFKDALTLEHVLPICLAIVKQIMAVHSEVYSIDTLSDESFVTALRALDIKQKTEIIQLIMSIINKSLGKTTIDLTTCDGDIASGLKGQEVAPQTSSVELYCDIVTFCEKVEEITTA